MNYAATLRSAAAGVAEPDLPLPPFALIGSELEIQARWFAGTYGSQWTTTDDRRVELLDFGTWNHEAGPDFTAATIRIGDNPAIRGAIEIDTDVRDWERHGHADNPAFDQTALHVFLHQPGVRTFTRTSDHREVPQLHLHEHTPVRGPTPTSRLITDDPTRASEILHAAAYHRLHRKAQVLAEATRLRGRDNAWFEALAVALGYKHNQLSFQLVAQRSGLKTARSAGGEARLFGLAGFLESAHPEPTDFDIRRTLRSLWDTWWDDRSRLERLIVPSDQWNFAGLRPANHPHRRLAALRVIADNWKPVTRAFESRDFTAIEKALGNLSDPFWSSHYNLAAAPLPKAIALIGTQRITDILLNVYFPISFLRDKEAWASFLKIPGPPAAAKMSTSASAFFRQSSSSFLKTAVHQQGLLQMQKDFDESPDPADQLERWRSAGQPG